jgi:hypothetical protein
MVRRITALILVAALAGLVVSPAEAKKKKKKAPAPVAITYHMNWGGDCPTGSGYLALTPTPNPDACALYFPGIADTYSFPGSEGTPFALDTTKPIAVDFLLIDVVSAAAEFEAVLTGTIDGQETPIASGTQTIVAAAGMRTPVHFDLEPDAALNNALLTGLNLTISWTSGVTYSTIDLDAGATMIVNGLK